MTAPASSPNPFETAPDINTLNITTPIPVETMQKIEFNPLERIDHDRSLGRLVSKTDTLMPMSTAMHILPNIVNPDGSRGIKLGIETLPERTKEGLFVEGSVRIPEAADNDRVWDANGELLIGLDGKPVYMQDLGLKPTRLATPEDKGVLTNAEGYILEFVDPETQKPTLRTKLAAKIYDKADKRYNFNAVDAEANRLYQELVDGTSGYGKDDKFRLTFAEWNEEGGYWMKYDGTPLTPYEVEYRETVLLPTMHGSPGYAMAITGYELRKREEHRQYGKTGTWLSVLNTGMKYGKLAPEFINGIHQGEKFKFKKQHLDVKHTPIYFVDGQGNRVDPMIMTNLEYARAIENGMHIVMGNLKERDFVTELCDRFTTGDMQLSPGSISTMMSLADEIGDRLNTVITRVVGEGPNRRITYDTPAQNRRNYQNNAWLAQKLVTAVAGTKNSMMGDEATQGATNQTRPDYAPSIYAAAGGAKERWIAFATLLDGITKDHPIAKVVSRYEYMRDREVRPNIRKDLRP